MDLQAAHDLAVASPLNPNAQGSPPATPVGVILATSNYLRSFLIWKTNGYPSSGPSYNAVNNAQKALDTISSIAGSSKWLFAARMTRHPPM